MLSISTTVAHSTLCRWGGGDQRKKKEEIDTSHNAFQFALAITHCVTSFIVT